MSIGVVHIRSVCQHRHGFDRQIEIRRRARHPIAKETLRRDPGNRHSLGIHPERTAHDGSVAGKIVLPRLVAHHRNHGGADNVIRIGEEPSRLRLQTEGAKVVARHKLAHHRPRTLLASIPPCNDRPVAKSRLHRGQFLKLRCVLLQLLIRVGREQRIVAIVVRSPTHAAVVVVAQPEQRLRIRHRQVLQQHRIDERKDRSVRPNAQRQRQNGGHSESRGLSQLPQRVANILVQIPNHPASVHSAKLVAAQSKPLFPSIASMTYKLPLPGNCPIASAIVRQRTFHGRWTEISSKRIDSNGANRLVFIRA